MVWLCLRTAASCRCPRARLLRGFVFFAARRLRSGVFLLTCRRHAITAKAKRTVPTRSTQTDIPPHPPLAQPKMKRSTTAVSSTNPAANASAASIATAAMRANRMLRRGAARRDRLPPPATVRIDTAAVHQASLSSTANESKSVLTRISLIHIGFTGGPGLGIWSSWLAATLQVWPTCWAHCICCIPRRISRRPGPA